ncbi:MAG: hypothetical protein B7Z47_02325 [Chthoniobacter sp. 12-60-6]|nr:MAG: hypothetical protein B7Z47_02325 [Chthoniobacter sp. 12-60-6]
MILAALLVPATMAWMSLRYYNTTRKQAERAATLENVQRQSAEAKRHETFFRPLESNSVEFAPMSAVRTSWNGQTDPDSVWHDQRREANRTLMEHGLPPLKGPRPAPDSPALPRSLRFDGQK